jgi:hypothetical protein
VRSQRFLSTPTIATAITAAAREYTVIWPSACQAASVSDTLSWSAPRKAAFSMVWPVLVSTART